MSFQPYFVNLEGRPSLLGFVRTSSGGSQQRSLHTAARQGTIFSRYAHCVNGVHCTLHCDVTRFNSIGIQANTQKRPSLTLSPSLGWGSLFDVENEARSHDPRHVAEYICMYSVVVLFSVVLAAYCESLSMTSSVVLEHYVSFNEFVAL